METVRVTLTFAAENAELARPAIKRWWQFLLQQGMALNLGCEDGAVLMTAEVEPPPTLEIQWVSVEERLPADHEPVLAYGGRTARVCLARLGLGGYWYDLEDPMMGERDIEYDSIKNVTHWAPWPHSIPPPETAVPG